MPCQSEEMMTVWYRGIVGVTLSSPAEAARDVVEKQKRRYLSTAYIVEALNQYYLYLIPVPPDW